MTRACSTPIPWATLVDYWAGDLEEDALDAVEEHLMGCGACTDASARVASVTEAIRSLIPPVISTEMLARLRERGLRILENPMRPGERRDVRFPVDVDLLIHRLSGLELADVTRVGFVIRDEASGRPLAAVDEVPFDREGGFVLVACQQHYASLPHDTVAELRLRGASGEDTNVEYTIRHHFEARSTSS